MLAPFFIGLQFLFSWKIGLGFVQLELLLELFEFLLVGADFLAELAVGLG